MTTRAEQFLNTVDDDELQELIDSGKGYAESTLKKHQWAMKVYKVFARRLGKDEEQIDLEFVANIVPLLMKKGMYEANGVEDVLVASWKRIYKEQQGVDQLTTHQRELLKSALKEGRLASNEPRFGTGKAPMITVDVEKIISTIPLGDGALSHDACLMTLAVHTGLRAVSCANIEIRDIVGIGEVEEENSTSSAVKYRLELIIRVTKGSQAWNHPINVEGYPYKLGYLDAVYWFRQHMIRKFGLNIMEYGNSTWTSMKTDDKKRRIFDVSEDGMRERVKARAEMAGYPKGLFGFHSLRSGFMGSAAIQAYGDAAQMTGALETTSFVAGWEKNSRTQELYVKNAVKRTMVASRLVAKDKLGLSGASIDKSIAKNPERFHKIKLEPKEYPSNVNMETFHEKLRKKLYDPKVSDEENKRRYNVLSLIGFKLYCEANDELVAEAEEMERDFTVAKRITGRQGIEDAINEDFSRVDELVDKVYDLLEADDHLEREIKTKTKRATSIEHEVRARRREEGTENRRQRWTEEEDHILFEVKSEGGDWQEISRELLNQGYTRTPKDCYDRYRVLDKDDE